MYINLYNNNMKLKKACIGISNLIFVNTNNKIILFCY